MARLKIKVGKDVIEITGDRLIIGARSSCHLVLNDPLAAQEHADVVVSGRGFQLVDRGSTLGTFLDGLVVSEPRRIENGSEIVIGVSRIKCAIEEAEGAESALVLSPDKKYFYYDDKKDALDWSKKEVAFGVFPPLGFGNWIAVFSIVLLLPFWFIPSTGDALLEPGSTWHGSVAKYHAELAELDPSLQDCNACHDSFSGTSNDRCLACHRTDVATERQHPDYGGSSDWQMDCVACHVDHRGTTGHPLLPQETLAGLPQTSCDGCHPGDRPLTMRTGKAAATPQVSIALAYDRFSHADHHEVALEAGGKHLDCAACHKPYAADVPTELIAMEGERPREFQPVEYETCLGCHSETAPEKRRLAPSWHGSEAHAQGEASRCSGCHGEVKKKDLRTVPDHRADRGYSLVSRSHADVSGPNGPGDCATCHRNGDEIHGGTSRGSAAFEHGTHVIDARPAAARTAELSGNAQTVSAGRGTCVACHRETALAKTLGDEAHRLFPDVACDACHTKSVPIEAAVPRSAPTARRADFPHDRHLAVEGGCFACHTFPGSGVAGRPVTPPEVLDCTKCHQNHAHVGVVAASGHATGTCQRCHPTKDGVADVVYSGGTVSWSRPSDPTFRHLSPGHAAATTNGDCAACHDVPGTWAATSVTAIPIPDESANGCRACHVEQRRRFHWR